MKRGFRRSTSLLALWAMLMLALVPTTGRLWKAVAGQAHVLAGAHGHSGSHHGHAGSHHGQGTPPDTMPHGEGDCAYCVLARGLATAGVQPPIMLAAPAGPALRPGRVAGGHRARARTGLGARGPPQHA
jgi:hypothetical protein